MSNVSACSFKLLVISGRRRPILAPDQILCDWPRNKTTTEPHPKKQLHLQDNDNECYCAPIFHRCLFHYKIQRQSRANLCTFISPVSLRSVSVLTAAVMAGRQRQLLIADDTPVSIKQVEIATVQVFITFLFLSSKQEVIQLLHTEYNTCHTAALSYPTLKSSVSLRKTAWSK